jgi:hypothetical protein
VKVVFILLTLVPIFIANIPLAASFQLSDSRNGMTCTDYQATLSLAWENVGGDWLDLDGSRQGNTPFATRDVYRKHTRQTIEWDITSLAQFWNRGQGVPGGMYLKNFENHKSSVVFHSRESKDPNIMPTLTINWEGLPPETLYPISDTTINCANTSGNGERKIFQVGNYRSAIVIFPFKPRLGDKVKHAILTLSSEKQHQASSRVAVYALSSPMGAGSKKQFGLAYSYWQDENIKVNPNVIFAENFEDEEWLKNWSSLSPSSNVKRVNTADYNGFTPFSNYALEVTIPKQKKQGINLLYRFKEKTGTEPDEMYFRYYLLLGGDWMPRTGGKMPGFAGTYGRAGWGGRMPDGKNGWSARGNYAVSSGLEDGHTLLGSYVYHAGLTKGYGEHWGWNTGPTGLVKIKNWHSVEQYLKLNDPGASNGVLQAWIDGVMVFDRRNIRFRDVDSLHIETLWVNVYHGGTTSAPQDLRMYIDNLVIARKYIGPSNLESVEP